MAGAECRGFSAWSTARLRAPWPRYGTSAWTWSRARRRRWWGKWRGQDQRGAEHPGSGPRIRGRSGAVRSGYAIGEGGADRRPDGGALRGGAAGGGGDAADLPRAAASVHLVVAGHAAASGPDARPNAAADPWCPARPAHTGRPWRVPAAPSEGAQHVPGRAGAAHEGGGGGGAAGGLLQPRGGPGRLSGRLRFGGVRPWRRGRRPQGPRRAIPGRRLEGGRRAGPANSGGRPRRRRGRGGRRRRRPGGSSGGRAR